MVLVRVWMGVGSRELLVSSSLTSCNKSIDKLLLCVTFNHVAPGVSCCVAVNLANM